MSSEEMDYIENALIMAGLLLDDDNYEVSYPKCYAFWNKVDDVFDWAMQEIIDPVTLEPKFYWRKKS